MKSAIEFTRWRPFAVLGLVAVMGLRASHLGVFDQVEGPVIDWLAGVTTDRRSTKLASSPQLLTLIELDDAAVERGWPLKPLDYAVLLRSLGPVEPAVVGVEEVLNWEHAAEFIEALERYVMRTSQVLLAWEVAPQATPGQSFEARPVLRRVSGSVAAVPAFDGAQRAPLEGISYVAAQGFVNLETPPGGAVRSVPMLFRAGRDLFPSFTLRAVMQWLKVAPDDVAIRIGHSITLGGHRRIPIDERGMMLIPTTARCRQARLALDELLIASERRETSRHPRVAFGGMKNQVLLVGRTDADSCIYVGPDGRRTSRAELLALAIGAIQREMYMSRTPLWVELAIGACLLGLLALMTGMRRWKAIAGAGGFLVAYLVAAVAMYEGALVWPPLVPVLLLVLLIAAYRLWLPARIQKVSRENHVKSLLQEREVKRFKPEASREAPEPPPDEPPPGEQGDLF